MSYLLATIRGRDRDLRNNAFVAVGLVSVAIEDHTKPYSARILDVIRNFLPSKVYNFIFFNFSYRVDPLET